MAYGQFIIYEAVSLKLFIKFSI